jgi:hypothetical protein
LGTCPGSFCDDTPDGVFLGPPLCDDSSAFFRSDSAKSSRAEVEGSLRVKKLRIPRRLRGRDDCFFVGASTTGVELAFNRSKWFRPGVTMAKGDGRGWG